MYDVLISYLNISEDVVSLGGEVVFHESFLTSTIPEIEVQVSQESDVGVLHVDGGAQPAGVAGDVVGEDDGAHRRLARTGLAHQQHLLLHDDLLLQSIGLFYIKSNSIS